jgi:hypothetical protein
VVRLQQGKYPPPPHRRKARVLEIKHEKTIANKDNIKGSDNIILEPECMIWDSVVRMPFVALIE